MIAATENGAVNESDVQRWRTQFDAAMDDAETALATIQRLLG
jgi:hypothetical protein